MTNQKFSAKVYKELKKIPIRPLPHLYVKSKMLIWWFACGAGG